jgi:hypothetical protein
MTNDNLCAIFCFREYFRKDEGMKKNRSQKGGWIAAAHKKTPFIIIDERGLVPIGVPKGI